MTMVIAVPCKFANRKILNLFGETSKSDLMSLPMDRKQLGCHPPLLLQYFLGLFIFRMTIMI